MADAALCCRPCGGFDSERVWSTRGPSSHPPLHGDDHPGALIFRNATVPRTPDLTARRKPVDHCRHRRPTLSCWVRSLLVAPLTVIQRSRRPQKTKLATAERRLACGVDEQQRLPRGHRHTACNLFDMRPSLGMVSAAIVPRYSLCPDTTTQLTNSRSEGDGHNSGAASGPPFHRFIFNTHLQPAACSLFELCCPHKLRILD